LAQRSGGILMYHSVGIKKQSHKRFEHETRQVVLLGPSDGVIARDATEIEAREKPAKKETNDKDDDPPPPDGAAPLRKRGRPRKDEERPKPEPTRLERQTTQNINQMLAELPTACDVGCKKNSKGYKETWIGYKLHLDVACGQIPVSCVLTSASVHDSQVAIPLMTKDRTDPFDRRQTAGARQG
jgi:hypothetical protein